MWTIIVTIAMPIAERCCVVVNVDGDRTSDSADHSALVVHQ